MIMSIDQVNVMGSIVTNALSSHGRALSDLAAVTLPPVFPRSDVLVLISEAILKKSYVLKKFIANPSEFVIQEVFLIINGNRLYLKRIGWDGFNIFIRTTALGFFNVEQEAFGTSSISGSMRTGKLKFGPLGASAFKAHARN